MVEAARQFPIPEDKKRSRRDSAIVPIIPEEEIESEDSLNKTQEITSRALNSLKDQMEQDKIKADRIRLEKLFIRSKHPLEDVAPFSQWIGEEVAFIKFCEKKSGEKDGEILHIQEKIKGTLEKLESGRDQVIKAIKKENNILLIKKDNRYEIGDVIDEEIDRLKNLLEIIEK